MPATAKPSSTISTPGAEAAAVRREYRAVLLPGKPGAPFAVISPGGGFSYVGSVHEGLPYAAAISKKGYNAFVLRYRAGSGGPIATQDLAAALSYIFRNAKKARCQHRRLFAVGQLGRRANGGCDRVARSGTLWRRRSFQSRQPW